MYGINNCDTVKKTKKWLEDRNADYEFHDYKQQGCPAELANIFLKQFPLEQVINKRGTTWRKLPEPVKENLNQKTAKVLMQENPSLIKRPILDIDSQWVIGFDIESLSTLIK